MVMDRAQTSRWKINCLILKLALICRKFKKTKFQKIYNSLKIFREVLQLKRSRMKSKLTSKSYQGITKIKSQVSILDRLAEKRQNVMQFHHGLQTSTTAKFFRLKLWRPAQAVSGLANASQTKDSGQKGWFLLRYHPLWTLIGVWRKCLVSRKPRGRSCHMSLLKNSICCRCLYLKVTRYSTPWKRSLTNNN